MKQLSCKAAFVVFGVSAAFALSGCIPEEAVENDASVDGDSADGDTGDGGLTCEEPKVLVCHVPPGNPDNAHEICIGAPAVSAHIRNHGDWLGPCDPEDGGADGQTDGGLDGGGPLEAGVEAGGD